MNLRQNRLKTTLWGKVYMNQETSQFSRDLAIEDFLEPNDSGNDQSHYRNNKRYIPKHQREFGQRKRIKP